MNNKRSKKEFHHVFHEDNHYGDKVNIAIRHFLVNAFS